MIVKLIGVTQKGKNRIKEHGQHWVVINHTSPLRPNSLFLESIVTGDRRWFTEDFMMEVETA